MLSLFDYQEPVEFLKAYVQSLPTRDRRGVNNKLAQSAGVFPSYLSQILAHKRQLNLDQALGIAEFLQLKKSERRYFLLMVQKSRAATLKLQEELSTQLSELKQNHDRISTRVEFEQVNLSDEEQAQFYSSWIFAAIRLATALPGIHTAENLAQKLNLPKIQIQKAIRFLLETGLCIEKDGSLQVGPRHTHLDAESVHISTLHRSWRLKAMDHHPVMSPSKELSYSLLACLSKEDALKIRSVLLQMVGDVRKISDPSESEQIYAFNLDWFQIC